MVPGLFDAGAMQRITSWTDEVQAYPETPGEHMMYFEESLLEPDERVLSRIENICPYHEGFNALVTGDELLGGASELLGEPAVFFKEKINFKLPGGGGFEAHQDMQAGWDTYGSLYITALLSIDEATVENGCLEIAAGAHTHGMIGEMWRPLDEDDLGRIEFAACPTRPGDGGFEAHQDMQAGWDTYGSLYITALLSIDEATVENGCLEIAAGAHTHGMIGEMWRPLDEDDLGRIEFAACPTRPGDAVFFDALTPHRSKPNMTAAPRRVLYVTYNRLSEGDHRQRYYADKRKSYPPDCEREPGRKYVYRV